MSESQLRVELDRGVAFVTLCNPPHNYLSLQLASELDRCTRRLVKAKDVRVVVFQSDVPGYFMAHLDLEDLQDVFVPPALVRRPALACLSLLARCGPPGRALSALVLRRLSPAFGSLERLRRTSKVTICAVEGRLGGVGSELAMALDMRFATHGAVVNQLEVANGVFPGGGATQLLPRLLGHGRALEVILGSDDLDAQTATEWGFFNRLLPAAELRPFVHALAFRLAGFPPAAIADAKRLIRRSVAVPELDLQLEAIRFLDRLFSARAQRRIAEFLRSGGQAPRGAARLGALNGELVA